MQQYQIDAITSHYHSVVLMINQKAFILAH